MFSFVTMSRSRRSRADKDFMMLSSDLSSGAASRGGGLVDERKEVVVESAMETGSGRGREDEETILEGRNKTRGF